MQVWLERAVIGLNLCPFAKSVHVKGQIHWVVSLAREVEDVRRDLQRELQDLQASEPAQRDTTVLVLPLCFDEFIEFNDFLAQADTVLADLGLQGELQIASFHPQFQFAGTEVDDITNCTNRAPYPALHLLREASIDRAVEAFPEAETIYEKNMQVLEQLGPDGWDALGIRRHAHDAGPENENGDKA
ncbi:DUF1415 domain-containing protein [Rhodoferax sp. BAB1]|nr:DUF1415 domain-containing protein [Rhodoferax sp. BAB1]QKO23924.1 DUF1415 domain-containing protein [Rhodoferax sp. BAB1]